MGCVCCSKKKSRPTQPICGVCATQKKQYQMVKAFKCSDLMCFQCVDKYFQLQLSEKKLFTCPSCNAEMVENSAFENGLTTKVHKELAEINFRTEILKKSNLKLCPDEKCEDGFVKVDPSSAHGKCEVCQKKYCLNCMLPPHDGLCKDIIQLKKDYNYKQCPKCKRLVEKVSGCKHISCRCGQQFCFNCEELWGINHMCQARK